MNRKTAWNCKVCGETDKAKFYVSVHGGYCKNCFNKMQAGRFVSNKKKIIEHMGGRCALCGYNKYYGALELHHIDPVLKDKNFARIRGWSWERTIKELEKCILLCATCHAEVEGGYATLV
jgi:hypothetical protein